MAASYSSRCSRSESVRLEKSSAKSRRPALKYWPRSAADGGGDGDESRTENEHGDGRQEEAGETDDCGVPASQYLSEQPSREGAEVIGGEIRLHS